VRLLLGEGAVLAHRFERPLAAELDEWRQRRAEPDDVQPRSCLEVDGTPSAGPVPPLQLALLRYRLEADAALIVDRRSAPLLAQTGTPHWRPSGSSRFESHVREHPARRYRAPTNAEAMSVGAYNARVARRGLAFAVDPTTKAAALQARTVIHQLPKLIAVLVATLALAPVASAATVTVRTASDDTGEWIEAYYVAAPGERNDVLLVHVSDSRLRISDPGAVIIATGRCRSIDSHSAACHAPRDDPFLYIARVELGDLDDRVATSQPTDDIELTADGGPGNDVLKGASDAGVLSGGAGDDQLDGGEGPDKLDGGDGFDLLSGGVGYDELNGGAGGDQLHGGDEVYFPGGDEIAVDDHGDSLNGGGGPDQLSGGRGNDSLTDGDRDGPAADAGPGPDTLNGGRGSDMLSYAGRTSPVSVRAGVSGDAGEADERDSIRGIENVLGGAGDDRLVGDHRANWLRGRGGDDALDGRGGADELWGGRGDDRLLGGRDGDVLAGGSGIDDLSCAVGDDVLKVVEGRKVHELVPSSCERLEFSWGEPGSVWLRSHPTKMRSWWLRLRAACPIVFDDAYVGCRGTIILRETGGRHRLLARGRFRRGDDGADFAVPLALTSLGYRWATGRLRGTSATVVLRIIAQDTPRRPFRWRIRAARA
jgi:RTX calcium-binding nonapeptide repeat (4 copies)